MNPYPEELDDDLRAILGRPTFACAKLAVFLRETGQTIETKAEHEQAAVLHWLLNLYLRHGKDWGAKAREEITEWAETRDKKEKS